MSRLAARQWSEGKISPNDPAWNVWTRPVDADIRHGLSLIRARARELAQNSDHAKGFLRIVRNNLVGPEGFVLQSRAALASGNPDTKARALYEREWRAWCKRGNCEVSGKFSFVGLQRHVAETVARDGESFVRIVRWDNRWGMALQVIDPEAVGVDINGEWGGREIRMGVELDAWRRPVAYHVRGEPLLSASSYLIGDRYRIPADEMIHVYLPEFCWQTRGVSWLAVGAGRAHVIQAIEDAEVTASRASAAKFAAYEAAEWAPPPQPTSASGGGAILGPDGQPMTTDPGQFSQDIAVGSMEVVPYGYNLKMLDPQHPNTAMPDFLKWALRSISTGWGVSYNTLGNDAEGVNYTSLRFFLGVERDNWREQQDWFCDEFPEPIRARWTADQINLGNLPTRPGRESQYDAVYWQPRRWEGPDPAKQADADRADLENGTTTLTEILARKGRDFDDLVVERIQELTVIRDAAARAGFALTDILPYLAAQATQAPAVPPEPDADDKSDP